MLLIHQGAAPTPRESEEWERLSHIPAARMGGALQVRPGGGAVISVTNQTCRCHEYRHLNISGGSSHAST